MHQFILQEHHLLVLSLLKFFTLKHFQLKIEYAKAFILLNYIKLDGLIPQSFVETDLQDRSYGPILSTM